MEKELISAFVDSELNEEELQQIQNEDRKTLKEVVNVYRVIGETVRYNQSQIQVSEPFQDRLREVLQQEYSMPLLGTDKNSDSLSGSISRVEPEQEESVA